MRQIKLAEFRAIPKKRRIPLFNAVGLKADTGQLRKAWQLLHKPRHKGDPS